MKKNSPTCLFNKRQGQTTKKSLKESKGALYIEEPVANYFGASRRKKLSIEEWLSLVQENKWLILGFVCCSRYQIKLSKTFTISHTKISGLYFFKKYSTKNHNMWRFKILHWGNEKPIFKFLEMLQVPENFSISKLHFYP